MKPWSSPAIAAAATFLFGVLLVWLAVRLIRGNREDILATAALAPQIEVELRTAGEALVMIEAPRMATDYRGFQLEVTEKQTGQTTAMGYQLLRAAGAVYGVGTVHVPLGRMIAPRPGAYVVRVEGMAPGKDYSRYSLSFSRPYLRRMTLQIIGIVLCGVCALLALIRALWLAGLLHQANR